VAGCPVTRAFHRGYRSSRTTRLHIMREDGTFPGRSGLCGTHGWAVTRSETVVLDPMPDVPPAGLSWCPLCVGRAAELAGVLGQVAAGLAGVR
jgi:hypothetical protein